MSVGNTWVQGIAPDAANRQRDDFYPTPPEGIRALLAVETFEGSMWEPACGDGAISRVLEDSGFDVYSSDLIDRGYGDTGVDFLLDYSRKSDNIITNPPFKHAEDFIFHSLNRAEKKVAMLLRLAFLEGQERRKMFTGTPISAVWVFSKRLSIMRNGAKFEGGGAGGMIAFAWFVWTHGYQGRPELGWL